MNIVSHNSLDGKKILILGGAYQHRKLVETAKSMGVITYVTDYLPFEESPAKQMADYGYMYNITDIEEIISLCRKEHIEGIIGPYLDVAQKPYQQLCERLEFPCFGNKEQHEILTNKILFKKFCEEYGGVDVIPYYTEKDIMDSRVIDYPILVKPCDSRGSRGQSICFTRKEALKGIEFAKSESFSGNIVIEKYMGTDKDLQLVYMVVKGDPILVRVEDRYLGESGSGVDKLCIATVSPSCYEREYREKVDTRMRKMIKALGLKNAPVFIQGFWDGDTVRVYDPGLRMPGDDYDLAYKAAVGIDLTEILITFALTGIIPIEVGKQTEIARIEKATAMVLPCVRPGEIASIQGIHEIENNPNVLSMFTAYKEGDIVEIHNNVKQRFGEFVIVCDEFEQLQATIEWLFSVLHVMDVHGNEMLYAKFDTMQLKKY